jgi:acetyl esterase/lipase
MMMIKALYIFAIALFFVGLLYHFAALKVFNFIVPKDRDSELVAQNISYGSDVQQKLDIYRPKEKGFWPVLIFVHGGSWKDGSRTDYEFVGRAFAAQGYVTLVIDYRFIPQHAFPDFVSDVGLAIAWANKHAKEYDGNGTQIYAVGHSAGAYNAALAILNKDYLRDAGAGPSSIKAFAGLAGPYDFLPLDSPLTIAAFGQVRDLPSTQPVNFARPDAPPFLLLHGKKDTTVFPRNSRSLAKHIIDFGGRAELKEYDDVSHVDIMLALARPFRNRTAVLHDIQKFFRDSAK